MNKRTVLLGLLASGNVFAQMGVDVMGSVYSTDLYTDVVFMTDPFPATFKVIDTQALTSPAPLTSTLASSSTPRTFGRASADTLGVSTYTDGSIREAADGAVSSHVRATAQTVLDFSPTADGIAPLSFAFSGGGNFFSTGFISLLDTTTSEALFYYSWVNGRTGVSTVPWSCCYSALLNLDTVLYDTHDYRLTMNAGTDANLDYQSVGVTLAGLSIASPAPEPETWAMMLLGLVGIAILRRSSPSRRF